MGYERDELITIGEHFRTESILEWSGQIVQAARRDLPRLRVRGITERTLQDVETSRELVKKLNLQQEREKKDVVVVGADRQQAIEAALDWREEIRGLAKALFDSEPHVLARFRTGVRSSRSIPKLLTEVGLLLVALREHLDAFKGVGVTDEVVKRGEEVLQGLEQAQQRLAEEHGQTPGKTAELLYNQGVLYTRVRFVVRIAQVTFRNEEERLGSYSYAPLRRQEAAAEGRRARAGRTAAEPVSPRN